ncbi:DNA-directed RNA polymerase I subunit RPA1-like [Montipora capricornis]|uniref:DNA-directed RNA polymerase I subunit RPA1-like n=1 Tax=Montipora capricornis TaxID=246305 RepID=UPI0035F1902E
MFGTGSVPFHYLQGLRLSLYSPEELKKLSVKKITNPETFDELLHPNFGGLYDPALGPTDKDDLCGTCAQNYIFCPGHFGHLELPLPVYHPLFFKVLQKILKSSCFRCGHLLIPRVARHVFLSQMKVLDYGLIAVADELQLISNNVAETETKGKNDVQDEDVCSNLDEHVKKALKDLDKTEARKRAVAKNVTNFRQQIIKDFTRSHMSDRKRYCPVCGAPSREVKNEQSNSLVLKGLSSRDAKKWIHSEGASKLATVVQNDSNETTENATGADKDDELKKLMQQTHLTPLEVKNQIFKIWEHYDDFLDIFLGAYPSPSAKRKRSSADMFFFEVFPVPPSRFRPISRLGDKQFENAHTGNLNKILKDCVLVKECLADLKDPTTTTTEDEAQPAKKKRGFGRNAPATVDGDTPTQRLHNAWRKLQTDVNGCIDSDLDKSAIKFPGIRQTLEKKEGLFRKHMMGKRVDYACRSVISPDPYMNVNEIGIPEVFALKLTYPQPVTHWNVKELRQAVINGPLQHPGATLVEHEDGRRTLLSSTNPNQRHAIAKRLLTPSTDMKTVSPCKKVYRHLQNGDVLLLNRQPTLHRPSMMAHKARILQGEKTIRLHYANCKSYNADFDGDEMNAHFPQNELARAEAYNLASTNYQYLVPKDGTPIGGLIQDHIVAGVRMTVRGRLFNRSDYQQLVYSALSFKNIKIKLLKPCIIKPHQLWSGKQVVSTVLINLIPPEAQRLSILSKAKITGKNWVTRKPKEQFLGIPVLKGDDMSESEVVIRRGELMCGVLDKAHYGPTPFGLVHCCNELYGGEMSSDLLTSLARLFTTFLQIHGFTLGVEDILVKENADKKRRKLMKKSREAGDEAAIEALGLPEGCERSVLEEKLQAIHHNKDGSDMKQLDLNMKRKTDHYQDLINRACIPLGLLKRFPDNNLQVMVQSGAKGSSVNCMQISCLLGQIELEGRRPPIMLSGRSLPSFLPYDTSPRAGGFVDGRFLTGIRPQEYFFHCMAGREGLVDTAVKTSRSGYLQRCLIKHMEGLQIGYDLTVRDSDGSVLQFYYGEDGLDVMKTSFMSEKQFSFMADNFKIFLKQVNPHELLPHLESDEAAELEKKINKWKKKHAADRETRTSPFLYFAQDNMAPKGDQKTGEEAQTFGRTKADLKLFKKWRKAPMDIREWYTKKVTGCPDPVLSKLQADRHFGAVSEKFSDLVRTYTQANPDRCLNSDDNEFEENGKLPAYRFKNLMYLKAFRALAEPGEAVGLLAAQSIGEPSTQMTLNTFHFAGRGEMNVTLGIPRLREILMTASASIKTPTMDLPLKPRSKAKKRAKQLQRIFTKVTLAQVLESVDVWESLSTKQHPNRERIHRVRFNFLSETSYKDEFCVRAEGILHYVESVFIKKLIVAVLKANKAKSTEKVINFAADNEQPRNDDESTPAQDDDDDDNAELSDEEGADGDANEAKQRQRRQQHASYEAPDEDEQNELTAYQSDEDDDANEDGASTRTESTYGDEETESLHGSSNHQSLGDSSRVQRVVESDFHVASYSYDADKEEWCEVCLKFPVTNFKVRVASIIEKLADQSVVYEIPGINRCFLTEANDKAVLKTEGVNLQAAWEHGDILDLTKIYTNDIHAMANTYGIEAAGKVIKQELKNVFSAYGINVDARHLSLVSDYMTYEGTIKAFNRVGMESNSSPFQKMSFETTTHFLRGAVLTGDTEKLSSPSSRLVVGRVVGCGTGCFDLMQPLY